MKANNDGYWYGSSIGTKARGSIICFLSGARAKAAKTVDPSCRAQLTNNKQVAKYNF